jgi:hypothetical protein
MMTTRKIAGRRTDARPLAPRRRRKFWALAGTIALVVITAVITDVVPRVSDAVWPPDNVPAVAISATQNGNNWNMYFRETPANWPGVIAAWNACDTAAGDSSACRSATLRRAGGVDEFGGAQVVITNTQKLSLQITSVRAIVDKRTPAAFAARFDSESGGLIGEALALDLNQDNSAAVHVEQDENAAEVVRSHRGPYLGAQTFEIEPGRTWKFGTIPVSTFPGVIEWHLEL